MKYYLLIFFILSTQYSFSQTTDSTSIQEFKGHWRALLQKAKQENKNIFLTFTRYKNHVDLRTYSLLKDPAIIKLINQHFIYYQLYTLEGEGTILKDVFNPQFGPSILYYILDTEGGILLRDGEKAYEIYRNDFIGSLKKTVFERENLKSLKQDFSNLPMFSSVKWLLDSLTQKIRQYPDSIALRQKALYMKSYLGEPLCEDHAKFYQLLVKQDSLTVDNMKCLAYTLCDLDTESGLFLLKLPFRNQALGDNTFWKMNNLLWEKHDEVVVSKSDSSMQKYFNLVWNYFTRKEDKSDFQYEKKQASTFMWFECNKNEKEIFAQKSNEYVQKYLTGVKPSFKNNLKDKGSLANGKYQVQEIVPLDKDYYYHDIAEDLQKIAHTYLDMYEDTARLNQALVWIDYSVKLLSGEFDDYSQSQSMQTQMLLLYQLGRKEEALKTARKIQKYYKKQGKFVRESSVDYLKFCVDKMEKGEALK